MSRKPLLTGDAVVPVGRPPTRYWDVHRRFEELKSVREEHASAVVAGHQDLLNAKATALDKHMAFEENLNRTRRHWTRGRHYASLTGAMIALAVAKILWATAVNLGEDNLDRDLAGVLILATTLLGGAFMLSTHLNFKKALAAREECIHKPVVLARMAFRSHLYPLHQHGSRHVGHAKPVPDDGDVVVDVERADREPHDPHHPIFVTEDNWQWLQQRTSANRWVTALVMSLVGASCSTGICMTITGGFSLAANHDGGDGPGVLAAVGVFLAAIAALGHCALVERWQLLPGPTGCEPGEGLMQDVMVHHDEPTSPALAK